MSKTASRAPSRGAGAITKLALAAPLAAGGATRIAQLLLLGALSQLYSGNSGAAMIVSFVLLGTFAQLSDSGALSYLLVHTDLSHRARVLAKVLSIQIATVGAGTIVALACAHLFVGVQSTVDLTLLAALGMSQLLDGVARVMRSPFLVAAAPVRFALPEGLAVLAKLCVIGISVSLGQAWVLGLCAVVSGLCLLLSWCLIRTSLDRRPFPKQVRLSEVLHYGLSSVAVTVYSQIPLLIATAVLPAAVVAPVAVGYRLAQATEFLPATVAQQLLPRFASQPSRKWFGPSIVAFASAGALVAAVLMLGQEMIGWFIRFPVGTTSVLSIMLISVAFRYANHILSTWMMADRKLRQRTLIAIGLGIIVASASILQIISLPTPMGIALVASSAEVVLSVALWVSCKYTSKSSVRNSNV